VPARGGGGSFKKESEYREKGAYKKRRFGVVRSSLNDPK